MKPQINSILRPLAASLAIFVMLPVYAALPLRTGSMLREAREMLKTGDYRRAANLADSVRYHTANTLTRLEALDVAAKAYSELSLVGRADGAYREGLEIFSRPEVFGPTDSLYLNQDYCGFLFNYGQFLLSAGDYDKCLDLIERVCFPSGTDEQLRLEGLRASALARKGETGQALELLDRLLADSMCGQIPAPSPTVTTLIQNRGFLHFLSGNYQEAADDLSAAMSRLGGKEKEITRANLALALGYGGDQERALHIVDEALENLEKLVGRSDADYITALRKKGEIIVLSGRKDKALSSFKDFFQLEKNRLSAVLPDLSPGMRLNYWTMEKPLLSRCFLTEEADPVFLFDVALMRRETSLLSRNSGEDPIHRINADSHTVKNLLGKNEAAVAFISYPGPDGNILYAAVTLDCNGKASFIPLFDNQFVYSSSQGSRALYDRLLSEDPRDKNTIYSDSILGSKIWTPIIETLPASTERIHFAPEGVFHLWGIENMPFPGKDKVSLIRHFSLLDIKPGKDSVNEAKALLAGGFDFDDVSSSDSGLPAQSQATNSDAYEELTRSFGENERFFDYLPGTANEIKACNKFLHNAEILSFLTEETLKEDAPSYALLHLATHGYTLDCGLAASALPTDSIGFDLTLLRSGVALTGANILGKERGRDDGILSAREICDLDLSEVDMVVLSACQTAKGLISDESASGLIRALKIAGAGTIVATLWEVDDRSAVLFMESFYKGLQEGKDRQSAIETARETTASYVSKIHRKKFNTASLSRKRTGEVSVSTPYAEPWYWAPFIIIDP